MTSIEEFLIILLDYAIVIPASALCFFPMQDQLALSRKRIVVSGLILFGLTLPLAALLTAYLECDTNFMLFPMLVVFFFFYKRCLTVDISRAIAVFFWVLALLSVLSNISTCIDARFNPDKGANTVTFVGTFSCLMLGIAADFIAYLPAKKYSTKLVNRFAVRKVWLITVPVTGIIFVMNCMMRPQKYETLYVNRVFVVFIAAIILMLAALLLLTFFFYYIVMEMLDIMTTRERNRILEMQESRYIKQQRYIEDTAKLRHDFKHTIRMLCELASSEEYDELKKYLSEYLVEMPQNDTIYYCRNHSVNAVLNYYTDQAVSAEIDLTMRIELPEKLPFSDVDLCGMIGNILDNAITACRELPEEERRIQFTMTTQNDSQLVIVSLNSFNGKVRKQGNKYFSTNRHGSGIGLDSIAETAGRCGGEAVFSHDSAKKEFYTDIIMPLTVRGIREDE